MTESLQAFFEARRLTFSQGDVAAARDMKNQQKEFYSSVFSEVETSIANKYRNGDHNIVNMGQRMAQFIYQYVRDNVEAIFQISDIMGEEIVVHSNWPLLRDGKEPIEGIIKSDPILVIVGLCVELGDNIPANLKDFMKQISTDVVVASRIVAYNIEASLAGFSRPSVEAMKSGVQRAIDQSENVSRRIDECERAFSERTEAAVGECKSEFAAASLDAISAFKKQSQEASRLKSVETIWRDVRDRNRTTFSFGAAISFVIVLGVIGLVIYFSRSLIDAIPRKSDGDIPLGGAAIFGVPLIMVGYIIRLVGRWLMTTYAISEDAAQRVAMIETYLAFIGEEKSNLQDADRVVMLNAIFRPGIGQQDADIAPPSVLDLINVAKPPSAKPST